jgi:hypothetical protein
LTDLALLDRSGDARETPAIEPLAGVVEAALAGQPCEQALEVDLQRVVEAPVACADRRRAQRRCFVSLEPSWCSSRSA